jgi:hypothetical protein
MLQFLTTGANFSINYNCMFSVYGEVSSVLMLYKIINFNTTIKNKLCLDIGVIGIQICMLLFIL